MYRSTLNAIKFIIAAATAASGIPLVLGINTPFSSKIELWVVYGHLILLALSLTGAMVILGHFVRCAYRNRTRIRAYWKRLMREYKAGLR